MVGQISSGIAHEIGTPLNIIAGRARLITELLANCLVRLGTIERPAKPLIQSLYSADRHFLLMKLREITFGIWAFVSVIAAQTCSACECGGERMYPPS